MIQHSVEGLHSSHLDIEIKHPRTHINKGKAQFTDYEIHVQTNNPYFPLRQSKVRRRYSEFVWLRDKLGVNDNMMVTPPSLPSSVHFGRFKSNFILERMEGLQLFLNHVVEVKSFLMDSALHLFLQTDLTTKEMSHYCERHTRRGIRYIITQLHHHKIKNHSHVIGSYKSMEVSSHLLDAGRGWTGGAKNSSSLPDGLDKVDALPMNHRESFCSEAHVLPSGQITLLESDEGIHTTDTDPDDDCCLNKSWHGKENDLVDMWLEEYDVIPMEAVLETGQGITNTPFLGLPSGSSEDIKSSVPLLKKSSACDILSRNKSPLSLSPSNSPMD